MSRTPIGRDPSLYPFVGDNYSGEYEGYVYYPWHDKYYVDPKTVKEYKDKQGLSPEQASTMDVVKPVAIATLATEGAKELGKQGVGLLTNFGKAAVTKATETGAEAGTTAAIDAATTTAAPEAVGTAINGGTLMADGSVVAAPEAPGLLSGLSSAPAFIPAAVIAQGLLSGRSGLKMLKGDSKRIDQLRMNDLTKDPAETAGRVGLAIMTEGLSELANTGLSHKSTKQYHDERWGKLSAGLQALDKMKSEENTGVWKDGKYAGEKWEWGKALDRAKENPTEFAAVLGNLETFGDKWVTTPGEKQNRIISRLIENGLYDSNKGDIIIKDPAAAQKIYDEEMAAK